MDEIARHARLGADAEWIQADFKAGLFDEDDGDPLLAGWHDLRLVLDGLAIDPEAQFEIGQVQLNANCSWRRRPERRADHILGFIGAQFVAFNRGIGRLKIRRYAELYRSKYNIK